MNPPIFRDTIPCPPNPEELAIEPLRDLQNLADDTLDESSEFKALNLDDLPEIQEIPEVAEVQEIEVEFWVK